MLGCPVPCASPDLMTPPLFLGLQCLRMEMLLAGRDTELLAQGYVVQSGA